MTWEELYNIHKRHDQKVRSGSTFRFQDYSKKISTRDYDKNDAVLTLSGSETFSSLNPKLEFDLFDYVNLSYDTYNSSEYTTKKKAVGDLIEIVKQSIWLKLLGKDLAVDLEIVESVLTFPGENEKFVAFQSTKFNCGKLSDANANSVDALRHSAERRFTGLEETDTLFHIAGKPRIFVGKMANRKGKQGFKTNILKHKVCECKRCKQIYCEWCNEFDMCQKGVETVSKPTLTLNIKKPYVMSKKQAESKNHPLFRRDTNEDIVRRKRNSDKQLQDYWISEEIEANFGWKNWDHPWLVCAPKYYGTARRRRPGRRSETEYLVQSQTFIQADKKSSYHATLENMCDLPDLSYVRKLIADDEVATLENIFLNGHSNCLENRFPLSARCARLLKSLKNYKVQYDTLFSAIVNDDLTSFKNAFGYRNCRFARFDGMTVLHVAVLFDRFVFVKHVLRKSTKVDPKDKHRRTPLHYAACLHSSTVYDYLISLGARQCAADYYRLTPLILKRVTDAQNKNQIAVSKDIYNSLINNHLPVPSIPRPDSGFSLESGLGGSIQEEVTGSPSQRGSLAQPQLLHFAEPKGLVGDSSLGHPLQTEGQIKMTQIPMPGDEDLETWIEEGRRQKLESLILAGHWDILVSKVILFQNNPMFLDLVTLKNHISLLFNSIKEGDLAKLKSQADRVSLFSAQLPPTMETPLHYAVKYGSMSITRYLCSMNKESRNMKDVEGQTPLHYAAIHQASNANLYETLLEYGCSPLNRDKFGRTPSDYRRNADNNQSTSEERRVLNHKTGLTKKKSYSEDLTDAHDLPPEIGQITEGISITEDFESAGESIDLSIAVEETSAENTQRSDIEPEGNSNHLLQSSQDYLSPAKTATFVAPNTSALSPVTEEESNSVKVEAAVSDSRASMAESSSPTDGFIKDWIDQNDFDNLDKAVMRGHGSKIIAHGRKFIEIAAYFENVIQNQAKIQKTRNAIAEGDLRRVKTLIDRKKIALSLGSDGMTALQFAIFHEQRDIASYLISKYPESVNITDRKGRNALHYVTRFGSDDDMYQQTLRAGANADAKDKSNRTPDYYRNATAEDFAIDSSANIETSDTSAFCIGDESLSDNSADGLKDMADISLEQIIAWMDEGNTEQLELLVLDGQADLLDGRLSDHPATVQFMSTLSKYVAKIDTIHRMVEEGDVRRVRSLIDRPALAMARDSKGATPLHNAVLHEQTDTVKYLLQRYPETVNTADRLGRTCLHYACADENSNHLVKMLQKAGADPFIEDTYGHTPFYYQSHPEDLNITLLKDTAVMDTLLKGSVPRPLLQGFEPVKTVPEWEVINLDLEEDINQWLQTGNVGRLEDLVLNGYGDFLLGRVNETEDPDVLSFLEVLPQYQNKIRQIHASVHSGKSRDVKAMIDRKKLVLARDKKGATPLHNAVLFDHEDLVKYFIRNYPQAINANDHAKRTPLHYAACLADHKIYNLLKKAKANTKAQDRSGRSPKFYLMHPDLIDVSALREEAGDAALKRVMQSRVAPTTLENNIQQWLLEGNVGKLEQVVLSGCGDLLLNRNRETIDNEDSQLFLDELDEFMQKIDEIHKSVKEGSLKRLKESMDKKRFAIARDRKGATPLHNAVLYAHTELIRFLAQHYPASLNAPDYHKRTPLHYAAASRDGGHIYKILGKAGADPTLTDNDGNTPEYYLKNPGSLNLQGIKERDIDHFFDLDDSGEVRGASRASFISSISTSVSESDLSLGNTSMSMMSDTKYQSQLTPQVSKTSLVPAPPTNMSIADQIRLTSSSFTRIKPTTPSGKYLASTIGQQLAKALAEVIIKRPADPILFLSDFLMSEQKALDVEEESAAAASAATASQQDVLSARRSDADDDDDDWDELERKREGDNRKAQSKVVRMKKAK